MICPGIETLTKSNFKLYCAKIYISPEASDLLDLEKDLKHITQVKRLISDYVDKGEVKDRLILNNIIILVNLFGPEHAVRILFFKVEIEYHSALKTFLRFLSLLPPVVTGLRKNVVPTEIPTDAELYKRLLLL